MNVAIQASDLDAERIDGTRVYLAQLLRRFSNLSPDTQWHIYHRNSFNEQLAPPPRANYSIHKVSAPFYWTQTRFVYELFQLRPDKLWMPVQALPMILPRNIEATVTIHDLAFRYFPYHFPAKDRRRLRLFAYHAVHRADKIIAVSESTKRDILKWYPDITPSKIKVIYHGFDASMFFPLTSNAIQSDTGLQTEKHSDTKSNVPKSGALENYPKYASEQSAKNVPQPSSDIFEKHTIRLQQYILYVGALQPRKNINVLLDAFTEFRKQHHDVQLVLAGEKAWLWESIQSAVDAHPFKDDIILTGSIRFEAVAELYRYARLFVFPSLYEGFGIPLLEAMASGVPVISAHNSSLSEVGGDAATYFETTSVSDLTSVIERLWTNETLRQSCIQKGFIQVQKFSWDACARETAEYILQP